MTLAPYTPSPLEPSQSRLQLTKEGHDRSNGRLRSVFSRVEMAQIIQPLAGGSIWCLVWPIS